MKKDGAVSVTAGGKINVITIESTHLKTVHSRGDLSGLVEGTAKKKNRDVVAVFYLNKNGLSLLEPNQSHT